MAGWLKGGYPILKPKPLLRHMALPSLSEFVIEIPLVLKCRVSHVQYIIDECYKPLKIR